MLSKVWNDYVVRPYQALAQEIDRGAVDYQKAVIKDAEKGIRRGVIGSHYMAVDYEEKLSPERAAQVIEEAQERLAAVQARLQMRAERFGFKP